MKRYLGCLFLFMGISAACFVTGALMRVQHGKEESILAAESSLRAREQQIEEMTRGVPAANREEIRPETEERAEPACEYYLVCEDGFLLVFQKDRETICLYTHIPITDLPVKEQEKVREGIGFSSMIEVMNYLESYTS
jgi:hypothetical protein